MLFRSSVYIFFFFNDTATTEIYTLSLHDALPISFTATQRMEIDDQGRVGIGIVPTSKLTVDGSFQVKRVASAVTISTVDEVIIGITDTSASRTINLQPADAFSGRIFILKDESGAAGTNNIIVNAASGTTIDGAASTSINTNYGAMRVYSDGTNFFTF